MIRIRPLLPFLVAVFLPVLFAACGKKGPPLAPLRPVPAAVDEFTGRRLGSEVHLRFIVPARNQDGSRPADLDRVEVYALPDTVSAAPDPRSRLEGAVLVGVVPVRAPEPADERRSRAREEPPRVGQGEPAIVVEVLAPELRDRVDETRAVRAGETLARLPPLLPPEISAPPARNYVVVGISRRGRPGPLSKPVPVTLGQPPPTPARPELRYTEQAITVGWGPAEGAPEPAAGGTPEEEPAEEPLAARPLVSLGPALAYNVYLIDPNAARRDALDVAAPLNRTPLATRVFTDRWLEFGVERCYAVRAIASYGTLAVESDPSPAACVTPVDTFPPEAPSGLRAVGGAGAVSLIWDPNAESDLAGYRVLRGEPSDATLQPLTREPIRETTYRDATAAPGLRYVYAIVAVDQAGNASAESPRVDVAAQ